MEANYKAAGNKAYMPKELEKRFAYFFRFADAEALVNEYSQLPPEKKLAEAMKSEDKKLLNSTLDTLFLKDMEC